MYIWRDFLCIEELSLNGLFSRDRDTPKNVTTVTRFEQRKIHFKKSIFRLQIHKTAMKNARLERNTDVEKSPGWCMSKNQILK